MKVNGVEVGPKSPLLTAGGRKRNLTPTEADDQQALIEFLLGRFWHKGGDRQAGLGLTRLYPELLLLYAINPNKGGQRSVAARGKAKAMGLLPGMPDLCLPTMRGPFAGLYLELKRVRGGKIGTEQERLLRWLRGNHYAVVVVSGVEAAAKIIQNYLSLPHGEPSTHASAGDKVTALLRELQANFYHHFGQ